MKRFTKRIFAKLAVLMALGLGWYAAGFMPMGTASFAGEQQGGAHHDEAASHPGEHDAGKAAEQLVPTRSDIPWLRPVMTGVVVLFAAAVVLGIPAMALKGPEPPEPAEHDEHGAHEEH